MQITLFPIALTLLGLALYIFSDKPKVVEVSRLAFFVGLLVTALSYAKYTIH